MNTVKKSFSILESFKQNRTRVSLSRDILWKRSRNSKVLTFSKQFSQKVKYNMDIENRTRVSPSKRFLNKRSRNSKVIIIQQTVFTKSKIQQGYRESR